MIDFLSASFTIASYSVSLTAKSCCLIVKVVMIDASVVKHGEACAHPHEVMDTALTADAYSFTLSTVYGRTGCSCSV